MKPLKLGSLLTAADDPDSIASIIKWHESAGSTFVLTNQPLPEIFGFNAVKPRKDVPSLWEALVQHLGRMRGREIIGIGIPPLEIPTDFSSIQTPLTASKMELNWAFSARARPDDIAPKFFVITTSLIPHIVRDLKDDVPFTGNSWALFLDAWCKKTMLPHKYIQQAFQVDYPKPVEPIIPDDAPEPVVKKKKKK